MLSKIAVDFGLSVGANWLERKASDLSKSSPVALAIGDTESVHGPYQRSRVKTALRQWVNSGAFASVLSEVRSGARGDVALRFVESFRQHGGYHEVDPDRKRTGAILERFIRSLEHRLQESGDLRPLTARVDRLIDGQQQVADDAAAIRQHVENEANPATDWRCIEDHSRLWMDRVQDTIAGTVRLPRATEQAAVTAVLGVSGVSVLVGESGTGKSAIAKALAEAFPGPVVWVSSHRLIEWTLTEWRAQLGLHHSVPSLAATVEGDPPLLVFDGLDRLYTPEAFEAVAEWLRAVQFAHPDSSWRILATCTPEAWDRVRDALVQQQIVIPASAAVDIGAPDSEELKAVWDAFPELRVLQSRDHLALVLRPKVLDLLARNRTALGDASLFGESDVARLFWTHEVAPPQGGIARAHAARALATALADHRRPSLRESTLFETLSSVGPSIIEELARDHVLTRLGGTVAFAHDLYADWVRAHTLREELDERRLALFLAGRTHSPVWQRALRLLGVDLLEQNPDPSAWRRAFDALSQAPEIEDADRLPLVDALLEALVFSVKRGIGLLRDAVWPLLAADGGHLLRRLLRRLRVAATQPDPALARYIAGAPGDPSIVRAVANASRVPAWPYWYGIVSFLHRHRDEIPHAAAGDAAETVDFWLRKTPTDFLFRTEAARVAVALGEALLRYKQEYDRVFMDDEPDQSVFRSVLAAAHEEPKAVTQILLEAIGRRDHRFDPPPMTDDEREAPRAAALAFPSSLGRSGPVIGPFPYGPTVRSDGALQKVVWSVDALHPLCKELPEIAGELLLASLISHARQVSHWNDLSGEYGLELVAAWHPTFYTHGPFLSFLRTDENHAVSTILRLLEHVEDRWLTNVEYFAREKGLFGPLHVPYVDVWVDSALKRFFGDANVFGWVTSSPGHGNALAVALTALEKHLYDRIDTGEDVSDLLARLLREGRSVALLGVLSSVLQRHPDLAAGPLRGLLVSPEVTLLVRGRAEGLSSPLGKQLWMMGLSQVPQFLHEEYEAWHTMSHRSSPLIGDLGSVVVRTPELAPFFAEIRNWLAAQLEPGGRYHGWDVAERIVMLVDPHNYHPATGPGGEPAVVYRPPEEWVHRQQEAHFTNLRNMMIETLPAQAATLYMGQGNGGTDNRGSVDDFLNVVAPDDAPDLWADHPDFEIARAALCLHPTLGSKSSNRLTWARSVVLEASERPDPTPGLYSFVGNLTRPPSVLPRAAVGLLARDPLDPAARTAVARHLCVSPLHDLIALAQAALVFSDRLGDDHVRITHALMRRAEIDARLTSAEQQVRFADLRKDGPDADTSQSELDQANRDIDALEKAFVERSLSPILPDLDELAPLQTPAESPSDRKRPQPYRHVNTDHLTAIFAAFPLAPTPGTPWYDALARYAVQTFGPLAPATGEESKDIEGLPDSWQNELLERLGRAVVALKDPDSAEPLWMPVLDIGAASRGWTEPFSLELTQGVFVSDPDPSVLKVWRRIIRYALSHPTWAPGAPGTASARDSGSAWRPLLGFTDVVGVYGWTEDQRAAVDFVQNEILEWAASHLTNTTSVSWFAGLLTKAAFASLSISGLVPLASAANAHPSAFWGRSGFGDLSTRNVSALLSHLWATRRADLRAHNVSAAFEQLLQALVARQDEGALLLAEDVRREGF